MVLLLYNFYSLHCPLSGPDLIYISLLIIPCIIYHVTNKETLNLEPLRHCHVRIEKGPVQTVAIKLEAYNSLEYHYMLKH